MRLLAQAPRRGSLDQWAQKEVDNVRHAGGRIPGVGHRLHTRDIRSESLLSLIPEAEQNGPSEAVQALAAAVARHANRSIPVNIDGAVAACLTHLGLHPLQGDLLFAIARSGGIAAHVLEERVRERPMRTIDPTAMHYDGPSASPGKT